MPVEEGGDSREEGDYRTGHAEHVLDGECVIVRIVPFVPPMPVVGAN